MELSNYSIIKIGNFFSVIFWKSFQQNLAYLFCDCIIIYAIYLRNTTLSIIMYYEVCITFYGCLLNRGVFGRGRKEASFFFKSNFELLAVVANF